MKGKKRTFVIFLSIISLAVFFSQCIDLKTESAGEDARGSAYAAPQTCIKCHSNEYTSYLETGHFHTSRKITGKDVPATLTAETNVFNFNADLKVAVQERDSGLYQVAYLHNKELRAQRFDIEFGSGEKAHTYGYWRGNKLFQLPLSYFSFAKNWANSPGFPSDQVYYDRLIISRCLECHASFADKQLVQNGSISVSEELKKSSIVYGIDCQRCHGPAADHVKYQLENPEDKTAKYITAYQTLSRQQKLDMCAVCHSGSDQEMQRSTFGFHPGDTLSNFYEPFGMPAKHTDVHGNQYGLLKMSKCFINSSNLTCTTCHNSHEKEDGNLAVYVQKCLDCHKAGSPDFCRVAGRSGSTINAKCIDCHMPSQASKLITFKMAGKNQTSSYFLRTHRIAVYPEVPGKEMRHSHAGINK